MKFGRRNSNRVPHEIVIPNEPSPQSLMKLWLQARLRSFDCVLGDPFLLCHITNKHSWEVASTPECPGCSVWFPILDSHQLLYYPVLCSNIQLHINYTRVYLLPFNLKLKCEFKVGFVWHSRVLLIQIVITSRALDSLGDKICECIP